MRSGAHKGLKDHLAGLGKTSNAAMLSCHTHNISGLPQDGKQVPVLDFSLNTFDKGAFVL